MIRVFLALVLLMSVGVSAQVFKWIDAEGHTQFSDRPQQDDAQTIELEAPKPAATTATVPAGVAPASAPKLGPYSAFEIVSPEPNQTLRQPQEILPMSLLLDPPLMEGHKIELLLDGAVITVERSAGTQLNLTGITFGSHRAYAQIRDSQGAIIAGTPVVIFHLRKPIPPGVLP